MSIIVCYNSNLCICLDKDHILFMHQTSSQQFRHMALIQEDKILILWVIDIIHVFILCFAVWSGLSAAGQVGQGSSWHSPLCCGHSDVWGEDSSPARRLLPVQGRYAGHTTGSWPGFRNRVPKIGNSKNLGYLIFNGDHNTLRLQP